MKSEYRSRFEAFFLRGALIAALFLSGCGKSAPTLSGGKELSYWIAAVHDPSPSVRKEAAAKLGNAGAVEQGVVDALSVELTDTQADVRCAAILALARCRPDEVRSVVPTLEKLAASDPSLKARQYAARAVKKLRGNPP